MTTINARPDAYPRRRFLGTAATALAAAELATLRSAGAQTAPPPASFAPVKQIDAGLLNVGYAEAGPANGPAVVLLHGWPYDIHSYVDVAPLLAAAGYRVIVPFCAVTVRRRFSRRRPSATASNRSWRSTSSR